MVSIINEMREMFYEISREYRTPSVWKMLYKLYNLPVKEADILHKIKHGHFGMDHMFGEWFLKNMTPFFDNYSLYSTYRVQEYYWDDRMFFEQFVDLFLYDLNKKVYGRIKYDRFNEHADWDQIWLTIWLINAWIKKVGIDFSDDLIDEIRDQDDKRTRFEIGNKRLDELPDCLVWWAIGDYCEAHDGYGVEGLDMLMSNQMHLISQKKLDRLSIENITYIRHDNGRHTAFSNSQVEKCREIIKEIHEAAKEGFTEMYFCYNTITPTQYLIDSNDIKGWLEEHGFSVQFHNPCKTIEYVKTHPAALLSQSIDYDRMEYIVSWKRWIGDKNDWIGDKMEEEKPKIETTTKPQEEIESLPDPQTVFKIAMKNIDNPEALANTLSEAERNEKWLPIEHLRQSLSAEIMEIRPPTLDTTNGWLSPEGDLYPCLAIEHNNLQVALERATGIKDLEVAGWIKLMDSSTTSAMFMMLRAGKDWWHMAERNATQAQKNTIAEWSDKHGYEIPEWIDDNWKPTKLKAPISPRFKKRKDLDGD